MNGYGPDNAETLHDIRDLLIEIRDLIVQFTTEPDTETMVIDEAAALNRTKES